MIETAIVLPAYMILLFGLLYFGYATLGRQRQDKATAYAAWAGGTQQADQLVQQFWGWQGDTLPTSTTPPGVQAGDTVLSVYGGGSGGPQEWVRQGDEYYGTLIPCQLTGGIHTLSGGGGDVFDSERVTVDLWNFALGVTTQSFNWTPGVGLQQQFNTSYTSFARYLNLAANPGGLLYAVPGDPPNVEEASPQGPGGELAAALNGPNGQAWLQRRAVETSMTYEPPFLAHAYAAPNAPPSTFSQYATLNYSAPPTQAIWSNPLMDCDVTVRNSTSARLGAEEGAQNPGTFLAGVGAMLGDDGPLSPPNQMDNQLLALPTVKGSWNPN
jgi:hypothetical protein